MQRILVAAFALLAFAGSAQAADKYAEIKTIGIVSNIGQRVWLMEQSFGKRNSVRPAETGEWDIDTRVVEWATIALSSRFAAKPIVANADPASCAADCMRMLAANNAVDAILVVHPKSYAPGRVGLLDPTPDQYPPEGIGIVWQHAVLGPDVVFFFASYQVTVFDRNGKELDFGSPDVDVFSGRYAAIRVDETYWPADAQGVERLKTILPRLVAVSLPAALHRANLVPKPARVRDVKKLVLGDAAIPYYAQPTTAPTQ